MTERLWVQGVKGALDAEIIQSVQETCAEKKVARLVGAYHRLSIALFLRCGVGQNLLVQNGLGHRLADCVREDNLVTDIAEQLPNACKAVNRRFNVQGFAWHENQPLQDVGVGWDALGCAGIPQLQTASGGAAGGAAALLTHAL